MDINIYKVSLVKDSTGHYDASNKVLTNPDEVTDLLTTVLDINSFDVEKLGILTLTSKNRIAGIHIISVGTLNSSLVHPREVFKPAILNNAASIIMFHNHPSGDPEPSKEDIETTNKIAQAGGILGIKVFDHIIVGENRRYVSLKQRGLI